MKSLIATICILAVLGVLMGTMASAGDTVSCTVTPGNYSVSVSPSSDPHGSMTLASSHTGTKITATNNGTLTAKINIKGADATYSSYTWTLSTTAPGEDIYVHAYSTKDPAPATNGTLGSDPTTEWVSLDKGSNYKVLKASLAATLTQDFYLDFRTPATPAAGTSFGNVYSTTVTLQAVSAS